MTAKDAQTMMDLQTETQALARADLDIEAGKMRVEQQRTLVRTLQATDKNTEMAASLLSTLQDALAAMQGHREFIVARIAQLSQSVPPDPTTR